MEKQEWYRALKNIYSYRGVVNGLRRRRRTHPSIDRFTLYILHVLHSGGKATQLAEDTTTYLCTPLNTEATGCLQVAL